MAGIVPEGVGETHPENAAGVGLGVSSREEGGDMSGASVSEVHAYPIRPHGFKEPLFPTPASRRTVAEHLLGAPWLRRASELRAGSGEGAHRYEEPVEVLRREGGVHVVRRARRGESRARRWSGSGRVARVAGRWREIGGWWEECGGTDRLLFRLEIQGEPGNRRSLAVVDVALDRPSGQWVLVGVVD